MQKIELPVDTNEATPTNPDFKWGGKMLGILFLFIIFSYLVFLFFSKIILANISLETEKKWFWNVAVNSTFDYKKYVDYNIEEFSNFNIYLDESEEINAFAIIWWNINITQGLLDNIENQEELIFVIAHEIGHIKHRDVLKNYTTKIPMQLTLSFLWFDVWIWNSNTTDIWWKIFSKNVELNSDKYAINLLEKYKINPLCASEFFEIDHNLSNSAMEMFSDHPLNSSRIDLLKKSALKLGFKDDKNCKKIKK